MFRVLLPLLSVTLSACGPVSAEIDPVGDDDDDTNPTPPVDMVTLSGSVVIPVNAVVPAGDIVVVALSLDAEFALGAVQGSVHVGAIAPGGSAEYSLQLPEEPAEDLYFQDEDSPETEIAAYMIGAYIDADGDGQPGPSDHYVGLAFTDVIGHVRGVLSDEAIDDGAELGWNHVVGEDDILPFANSLAGLDVEANILEIPPSEGLPFEVVPPTDVGPAGSVRVDLYSSNGYFGVAPADPTLVSVDIARGSGSIAGVLPHPLPAPPDDHYSTDLGDGPIEGVEIALYSGLAYVDGDSDGAWSGDFYDEAVIASSDGVLETDRITILHIRATGFQAAFLGELFGGVGWTLFREGPDPEAEPISLSWDDGIVLDDLWD